MATGGDGMADGMARRAAMAGALAALAGCAAEPPPPPRPVPRPEPPLAMLRDASAPFAIGGEALDLPLLRRFYARRGFALAWEGRADHAAALAEAVLDAGSHGLDPARLHGALLRGREALPARERDVALSAAVLAYADALANGRVAPARRSRTEALAAPATDPAAALDAALDGEDPRAAIEALAPAGAGHQALRAALRQDAGGSDHARRRALAVNLERERWLPRDLPPERIHVNVADQHLAFFRDGRPVLESRVVVGREAERDQSPEFQAMVEGLFVNPPWVVPRDIVEADILPRLREDPGYLARRGLVLTANGEVEQPAGPGAALGVLLFDMPNRFDVFLHDTPARQFFSRGARRLSYGCIRVEKPRELAALVMRQPVEAINAAVAKGGTERLPLPSPVPVFVTYQTAFADAEGRVQFRPDFYGRDARLWQRLNGA